MRIGRVDEAEESGFASTSRLYSSKEEVFSSMRDATFKPMAVMATKDEWS